MAGLAVQVGLAAQAPVAMAAAVVAKPDARWGETPCAFVELKAGAQTTPEQIVAHCKQHLAGFKVPRTIDFVKDMPRNPAGKVERKKVRAQYWEGRKVQI